VQKKTYSLTVFLGSARVKAAGKTQVKLTPAINFINLFLQAFFVQNFGTKLHFSLAPKIRTKNAHKKC